MAHVATTLDRERTHVILKKRFNEFWFSDFNAFETRVSGNYAIFSQNYVFFVRKIEEIVFSWNAVKLCEQDCENVHSENALIAIFMAEKM